MRLDIVIFSFMQVSPSRLTCLFLFAMLASVPLNNAFRGHQLSEDLSSFLVEQGVPTAYLHSGVKPMQRLELLRQLRSGEIDVIVGVNLLREARIYCGATVGRLSFTPRGCSLIAAAGSDISIQQ